MRIDPPSPADREGPGPPGPLAALDVRDLGRRPYREAFGLQTRLQREVIEGRAGVTAMSMPLLLVEHAPPVITVSGRQEARRHLVATAAELAAAGVGVEETNRGGDITYHGPGQLVVYPIFDLNRLGLRLHGYMRFLEQVVIDVLGGFALAGERDAEATGVWVTGGDGHSRKICAMGVRVSRWVAMHGLALNVDPDLDHFALIVPCGLGGRSVTSIARERPDLAVSMTDVKRAIVAGFEAAVAART